MRETSQIRYIRTGPDGSGGPPGPGGLLGRIVAFIVGLGVFAVAVFLGAVFIAAVMGLVLIVGLVVTGRVWWLKRKFRQHMRDHGDLDADYTVVRSERPDDGTRHDDR